MEKFELTPAELMTTLNWGKSKVYYWIKSGKFETVDRETSTNVLISTEQIERLKNRKVSESSNEFENSSEISEIVQENSGSNITKHYKNVSNVQNSSNTEFYNEALSTMKEMYQTFVQSQTYNMKLLTDGKSETQAEILELRAENKELSQKIQKSSNSEIVKNCVIAIISPLLVVCFITIWILSNSLIKFQTVSNVENVQQVEKVQNNLVQNKNEVQAVK